jgi:formamidopyrimidine-DNA glycosylase
LAIDWSGDLTLLAHFKLAGQLAVIHADGSRHVAGHPVPAPDGDYPHKATHVIYRFADGTTLYHSDIRQFGWLRLMPTADAEQALAAFGFADEGVGPNLIAADTLRQRLARRRIPIKQALLDQAVVAGLGNIYVDEALHEARLHPARPANSLTDDEFERLYAAIPWALERGIAQGGAKIIHGRAYPADGFPAVHGREGEACFRCGATIVKTRVGGRGTYLCPVCQPEPAAS